MEHGFPPHRLSDATNPGLVMAHVVLLLLLIAIGWGVVATVRRPASQRLANHWGRGLCVACGVFWCILAARANDETDSVVLRVFSIYCGLAVLEGFVGMLVCDFRFLRLTKTKFDAAVLTVMAGSAKTLFIVLASLVPVFIVLSLPQHRSPRDAHRRSDCKNNLKQLGLAAREFVDAHAGEWPRSTHGEVPVSWRVALLPDMQLADLRKDYDDSRPWDDEKNTSVVRKRVHAFRCASASRDFDEQQRQLSAYVMVTGPGTIAPGDRVIRNDDIRDGLSNTALFVEAVGLNVVWTEPRDADVSRVPIGVNLKDTGKTDSTGLMSSYHPDNGGGAMMVLADGGVRFINQSIDPHVLKSLTTIAGGEPLPPDW